MTKNQIDYWKNLELKRNNLVMEAETKRANLAREAETHRSNVVHENINLQTLQETQRHNTAQEYQASASLGEQRRHNVAQEDNDAQRNLINQQNYAVINAENQRHNLATESTIPIQNLSGMAETELKSQQRSTSKAQQVLFEEQTNTEQHKQTNLDADAANKGSNALKTIINVGAGMGVGALMSKVRTVVGAAGLGMTRDQFDAFNILMDVKSKR